MDLNDFAGPTQFAAEIVSVDTPRMILFNQESNFARNIARALVMLALGMIENERARADFTSMNLTFTRENCNK